MKSNLLTSSLLSMAGGLATTGGGFASGVLIARMLDVERAGQVNFLLWVISIAAVVALQGRGTSLARFLPDLRLSLSRDRLGMLVGWLLVPVAAVAVMIALAFILFALSSLGGRSYSALLIVAAVGIVLQSFANFYTAYLRGSQLFNIVALQAGLSAVLQVIGVAAGGLIAGAAGALAGCCLSSLIPALSLFVVWKWPKSADSTLTSRISRFAHQAWVAELIGAFLWGRIEILLLQAFTPGAELAYFAIAISYGNLAAIVPTFLASPLLPRFSAAVAQGGMQAVKDEYASATRVMSSLVLPACMGLAALTPSLLPLLYGQRFEPAIWPAMIIAGGSACLVGTTPSALIYAAEHARFGTKINLLGLIAITIAGLAIIPRYGAFGAAITRVVIETALVLTTMSYIRTVLGIATPVGAITRVAVGALLAAAVAHFACRTIPGAPGIAMGVSVGAATYGASIRLLGGLENLDVFRLSSAASGLPPFLRNVFCHVLQLVSPVPSTSAADRRGIRCRVLRLTRWRLRLQPAPRRRPGRGNRKATAREVAKYVGTSDTLLDTRPNNNHNKPLV